MKGILFKPDMIEAIIEGRKTQTRRVIKQLSSEYEWKCIDTGEPIRMFKDGVGGCIFLSPRYQVGETVYIKEKALYWDGGAGGRSEPVYADDPEIPHLLKDNNILLVARETTNIAAGEPVVGKWQWKSPLFMAEEDARYFILIKDVRAERLQEITETDAIREGMLPEGTPLHDMYHFTDNPIEQFAQLWDSINPKYPWESNPWVWPITFRLAAREVT